MAKAREVIFWLKQIDKQYVGHDAEELKAFILAEDHKLRKCREVLTNLRRNNK